MTHKTNVQYLSGLSLLFNLLQLSQTVASENITSVEASFYEPPCHINESIVLDAAQKQTSGSYVVDGVIIPPELVFNVTDSTQNRTEVRGCMCLMKTCVRWCCSNLNERMEDLDCTPVDSNADALFEKEMQSYSDLHFRLNRNLKCKTERSYNFYKHYGRTGWSINDNGSLLIHIGNTSIKMVENEYCLALYTLSNGTSHRVGPNVCIEASDNTRQKFFGISLLLAQPFMIVTIIVYLAIPKLRNLLGKSLICYLSSLSLSYFCLAYILLWNYKTAQLYICIRIAYVCYISIMSAYFWLSAICFNLWLNLTSVSNFGKGVHFSTYCVICYGTATIYAISAYLVQNYSDASQAVKPGFGDDYCYLNIESGYSAVIWLYQPLIFVITFNIVMFALTWIKIQKVGRELKEMMDKDSKKNLKNERNELISSRFHLFLRLFVIMGVSWIAEIISYFAGNDYIEYFYLTDLLNVMQGLLIFLVFVLKKETRALIKNRFAQDRASSDESQSHKSLAADDRAKAGVTDSDSQTKSLNVASKYSK